MDNNSIEVMMYELMKLAVSISNIRKPWMDNNYGRAATALSYILSNDHPLRSAGMIFPWPVGTLI